MTYTTIDLMGTTFWVEFEESFMWSIYDVTIMDWISDNEYLNENVTRDMFDKVESDLKDEIIVRHEEGTLEYDPKKYEQLRTGDIG